MHPHGDFRFMAPDGVMDDGDSYVDLSQRIEVALRKVGNGDPRLDPGETVDIAGVEVYSRLRVPPAAALFEIWAQRR